MGRRKAAEPSPPRRFLVEELPREGYWRHWVCVMSDRDAVVEFAKGRVSGASFAVTDITDLSPAVWARGEWTEVSA